MKPKLLLLHGALGSKEQFTNVITFLNDDFEIDTLNFAGHGGNAATEEFSIALFAKNVHNYLRQNEIAAINIFGYSMGGYVALKLAVDHPEMVEKIVTLGTKFDWNPATSAKEVKMLNPDIIEVKVPKFAAKLKADHEPEDWKVVMKKTAVLMTNLGNGDHLAMEDIRQIKTKVRIGIGSLDKMVSLEESRAIARELPNGELFVLEDVPHPIDRIATEVLANFIRKSFDGGRG